MSRTGHSMGMSDGGFGWHDVCVQARPASGTKVYCWGIDFDGDVHSGTFAAVAADPHVVADLVERLWLSLVDDDIDPASCTWTGRGL